MAGGKNDAAAKREQAEAWVGDAVLALYVREYILENDGLLDGEKFARFTSNSLLSDIGNPTSVEAEIGRVYAGAGGDLKVGFDFIEEKLLPVMLRRERSFENRRRQLADAKKAKSKRTRWAKS